MTQSDFGTRATAPDPFSRPAWIPALTAVVLVHFLFHALFVPAYEGPDEPFHLARVAAFLHLSIRDAFVGNKIPGSIVSAVRAHPCTTGKYRTAGCQSPGPEPAYFNLLRSRRPAESEKTSVNPEANQPPLFYMAAALVCWLVSPIDRLADSPDSLLLFVRLFAVGLMVVAIGWPLRKLAYSRSFRFALLGLLALLLPGASESLARAANDAGVFVWAAALMWSLEKPVRAWVIAALVAIGPLIKLTALPIVVMAVTDLWISRRRNASLVACFGALLIVPLQWLRGWHWGGTLELNRPTKPIVEPLSDTLVGFARSAYTFAKTTIWLGEWSVFRPPLLLLLAWGMIAIVWIASVRWKPRAARVLPHLFGIAIAVCGFVTFAIANRRYFGGWGGVGGWYVWGWFPWLVVAADDLLEIGASRWRWLSALTVVCVVLTDAVYYWIAVRLYG